MTARRWITGLALAVGALGLLAAPVEADRAPASGPSLTDVGVHDGRLTAVLTVPAHRGGGAPEPGGARMSFGSVAVPARITPVTGERRAAMVVIDTSGSMAGAGLAAAQAAARAFLREVPADVHVGLAGFAGAPRLLVAPTTARAPFRAALRELRAGGATSLYDGMALGLHALGTDGSRTLVVLSDGVDTASSRSLTGIERMVAASGTRPVTVGFRTGERQSGVLDRIARAGHGVATTTLDPASLRRAFGSAARAIAAEVRVSAPVPATAGGRQHVTIALRLRGRPVTAGADVLLPAAAGAPPSTAGGAERAPAASGGPTLALAAGAVFLGCLVLALGIVGRDVGPVAKRRLRALDRYLAAGGPATPERQRSLQGVSDGLTRAADAYIGARSSAARTGVLLERADLPLKLNEWYVLRALALPASAAVFWVLFRDAGGRLPLTLLATALCCGIVPPVLLGRLAGRRARAFELQLPDVLTLVASSLATGFSLPQALDAITRDAEEPAAKEFSRALAETRIGVDLEDALDRVAERMRSTNLAWTTMAIRIQRRVGGNLAEVMQTTAATLRGRESLRRQVRALSAEGRLSAYILIALPLVMGGYLYLTNRPYISLLWSRSLGVVMLTVGSIMMVVGVFWMRRIVDVKV
ncbi:MAG: type II secretion system F family protein [Marmoricola sp.]